LGHRNLQTPRGHPNLQSAINPAYNKLIIFTSESLRRMATLSTTALPAKAAPELPEAALRVTGMARLVLVINLGSFVVAADADAFRHLRGSEPFAAALRYLWHVIFMVQGKGAAAHFATESNAGWRLPVLVLRAHMGLLRNLPRLLKQRRKIQASARVANPAFCKVLRRYSLSPRKIASY